MGDSEVGAWLQSGWDKIAIKHEEPPRKRGG